MTKRPLIIDTDTGCGFVHAAMLVSGCGLFEIQGICTVFGSAPAGEAAVHAAWLRDICGIECPVIPGAQRPLLVRRGGAAAPDGCSAIEQFDRESTFSAETGELPWEFIYRKAVESDGEAELFCTGPLSNIAIAVIRHRDLPKYIKRITIAAGASKAGNATAYAEYNVYSDPHAFKCVLDAGFRQIDLVDLQFCGSAYLDDADAERLAGTAGSNPWKDILASCERERIARSGLNGLLPEDEDVRRTFWHDAAAAFVLSIPAAISASNVYTMVELRSDISSGRTLFDFGRRFTDDPNVRLAIYTSRDMFADFYFRCLRTYDRRDAE